MLKKRQLKCKKDALKRGLWGTKPIFLLEEQRTENPCVAGSIPARATFIKIFTLR
jgi:hypothetical protein